MSESVSTATCPTCNQRRLPNGVCACPAPTGSRGPEPVAPPAVSSTFGQAQRPPSQTSYEAISTQLRERQASRTFTDTYLRSSESTFPLPVKLLLSLPALVLPTVMVAFKLWLSAPMITLLILSTPPMAWYLKSVWKARD